MTDLVFLLLIFFIIISTFVNTSHQIQLPDGSGDPSLTSPVKNIILSLRSLEKISYDLSPLLVCSTTTGINELINLSPSF